MSTSGIKNILFIGNGPNLLVDLGAKVSWDGALSELEKSLGIPSDSAKHRTYAERTQVLEQKLSEKEKTAWHQNKAFQEWLKNIAALKPTVIHKMLAALVPNCIDAILTTNYDYAMERALGVDIPKDSGKQQGCNLKRKRGRKTPVFHLHGEANVPDSVIMFPTDYEKGLQELIQSDAKARQGSWLEHFLEKEVHICGFGYGDDETERIVAHAIRLRQEHLQNEPNFSNKSKCLYFYEITTEDKVKARAAFFAEKHINYIPVLLHYTGDTPNYRDAWLQLLGELQLNLNNRKMWAETTENTPLCLINRYHGQAARNMPLSTANVCHFKFNRYFRVTLVRSKLQQAAEKHLPWLFYCRGDGGRGGGFCADAQELLNHFTDKAAEYGLPQDKKPDFLLSAEDSRLYVPQPYSRGHECREFCTLQKLTLEEFNQEYKNILDVLHPRSER